MRRIFVAEDLHDDAEEGDGERRHKQGQCLCGPEQTDEHQQRQAILLLGSFEDGECEHGEEDAENDGEMEERRVEKPRRAPDAAKGRRDLLEGGDELVVSLEPRLCWVCVDAEERTAEARGFCSSLETDEVSPHRVPLPDDVLSQVRAEVPLGQLLVAFGDNGRVGLDHPGDVFLQKLNRLGAEGVGRADDSVHVLGSKFAVDNLVKLFEHLAEARLVELDVRLELAQLHVEVDDPSLQHDGRGKGGGFLVVVKVDAMPPTS